MREGTDFMEIEAEIETPSVLLVTDAWTPSWRAVALAPGGPRYDLMPANHALRALALDRGKHHFRIEYAPGAFAAGQLISLAALAVWLGAAAYLGRRGRRA